MEISPTLHHLALGADDVESLAAFYRDTLGLPEVARHDYPDGGLRSIWLSLSAGSVLMVEPYEQDRQSVAHHSRGLFLLGLQMPAARRTDIESELGAAENRTEFTSYFRDPEGNRFALSDYPLPDLTKPR
jgi:catechol 2,3-dioxygenase-like lactoylglutathione lyase family enzyme